jgi:hypothetical protein
LPVTGKGKNTVTGFKVQVAGKYKNAITGYLLPGNTKYKCQGI